ncbi:Uncharacterized protein APZ42_019158 [Daphnia magna]|uniref:DUF4806 domain-containing protein n=1 Tax=Daphnia magna TaxID=35525 RepID=A0A162CFP9_9CRUS|nr:Uncharacterized protein APZ42_019158 [Daphnia magna]
MVWFVAKPAMTATNENKGQLILITNYEKLKNGHVVPNRDFRPFPDLATQHPFVVYWVVDDGHRCFWPPGFLEDGIRCMKKKDLIVPDPEGLGRGKRAKIASKRLLCCDYSPGHENTSKSRGEFNMSRPSCLETKGKRSVIRPTERNAHRENDDFEQTQDSISFGFDAEKGEHEQDSNEGNYRISSIQSSPQLNHQVARTSFVGRKARNLTEVLLENCVLVHHPRHFNPPAVKTETSGVIVSQVTYRFFPASYVSKEEADYELMIRLRTMQKSIDALSKKNTASHQPEEFDKWTLTSYTEFMALNRRKKDKEFKQQTVDELKMIGGNDTGDLIRRIISRLMTKALQREFSVDGLRGNRKLKDTEVWSTIISATKDSPDSKGATDKKNGKAHS